MVTGTVKAPDYSNQMNILYLNLSFDEDPWHSELVRTLYHEFSHMINYSKRRIQADLPEMELWMNEGIAESAEHYGTGTYGESRVKSMNYDGSGRMANGCSLVVWGGDDISYGMAYTFMQYLRLHANAGWGIMPRIMTNQNGDYRALETVMSSPGVGHDGLKTFADMVGGYHRARFVNSTYTGSLDGFGSEGYVLKFTPRAPSKAVSASTKIQPGGAIYIPVDNAAALNGTYPNGAGPNIKAEKLFP
jgi:hypothetical protein